MKDIKDYLHLYLGCECKIVWIDEQYRYKKMTAYDLEIWYEGCVGVLTEYMLWLSSQGKMKFELHLRPLSDILNTEAYEVYKIYFGKEAALDFSGDTGSAYFTPKKVRVKAEHALQIFNGEDYETGDFMKVIELVPYLLSKHFDLFGLIEAGLAIDKTKL